MATETPDRTLIRSCERAPSSWGLGAWQAVPGEHAPAPEAHGIVKLHPTGV